MVRCPQLLMWDTFIRPTLRGPASSLAHKVCSSPRHPAIEVLYDLRLHSSHQGTLTLSPVHPSKFAPQKAPRWVEASPRLWGVVRSQQHPMWDTFIHPPLRGPACSLAHRAYNSPRPPVIKVLSSLGLHSSPQGMLTLTPVTVLSSKGASIG